MKKGFVFFPKLLSSTIYSVVFLFFFSPAYSQTITNQSNLFIPTGLEMHTNGNLTNTGFFQNNGSFFLGGDWSNTNVYQGMGLVSLEGIDQIIFNNNQTINQLTINGGGMKTLQAKLSIEEQVAFNEGVVVVSDLDTLVLNPSCEVAFASSRSYVDGALTSEGTGYKFFPVGKNGNYHPVELLDVKGINSVNEVEVFETLPEIQTSLPTNVHLDIYWTRKTISGSFDNSPITLGYTISNVVNLSRFVIAEGISLTENFSLIDNVTVNTSTEPHIVGSRRAISGNIFAVGELISDPPREYYFSTTLSPNASSPENRTVKIFGDNIGPDNFSFQVFNRWGLLIYESQSFSDMESRGWDGSDHGKVLPSGVYPYSLKYVDTAGQAVQRSGFVTIIH